MKIAVVEDEQKERRQLCLIVEAYFREKDISLQIHPFESGEEIAKRAGEFFDVT